MWSHRENTILRDLSSSPEWGGSYTVIVCSIGATASASSSGTTVTVNRGHGFAVGDKVLVNPGSTDNFIAEAINSVTATTLVYSSATPSITSGDVLVNLGADSSSGATPTYDEIKTAIYSDPDGGTRITDSTLTTDSIGGYAYWHQGDGMMWELILDGSSNLLSVVEGYGATSRFNVMDYGAIGDGVANDYGAIQAAITAVPQVSGSGGKRGGTVFFPYGWFLIATGLEITNANIKLVGSGGAGFGSIPQGASTIQTVSAITCLKYTTGVSWGGGSIEDLCFRDTSGAGTATGAIWFEKTNMFDTRSLNIVDFTGGYGMHYDGDGDFVQYHTHVGIRIYDCLLGVTHTDKSADITFVGGRFLGRGGGNGVFRAGSRAISNAETTTGKTMNAWNFIGTTFNDWEIAFDLNTAELIRLYGARFEQSSTNDGTGTAIDMDAVSLGDGGIQNSFFGVSFFGFSKAVDLGANTSYNAFNNCTFVNTTTNVTDAGVRNTFNNCNDANDGTTGLSQVQKYGMYYGARDSTGTADYRVGFNFTAETNASATANALSGVPIIEHPDLKAIMIKNSTLQGGGVSAAGTDGGLVFGTQDADTAFIGIGWAGNPAAPIMQGATACSIKLDGDEIIFYTWVSQTAGDQPGFSGVERMNISNSNVTFSERIIRATGTLANDATPSVSSAEFFKTGGTTTITDFDNGIVGQKIIILSAHAITITDGSNILLNGSANFVMAAGDTLTLAMFNDQVWVETGRMVN